jgi:hypothetical protein
MPIAWVRFALAWRASVLRVAPAFDPRHVKLSESANRLNKHGTGSESRSYALTEQELDILTLRTEKFNIE